MSKQNILFAVVGAAFIGIIWASVHFLAPSDSNVIRGNFDVTHFTYNRSGSEGGGSGLTDVKTIRLCPGYVVVEQQGGEARVFFGEYTQQLGWKRVEATPGKK